MGSMKVGLLGLGRGGRQLCDALLSSSWCELVAVASPNRQQLERFSASHPNIAAYDDFRSLIVERPLNALFMAIPPFKRTACLNLAVERSLPVWMLPPTARRFDETVEIMTKFEQAGCPLVVSRSWGFEPALGPHTINAETLGSLFFARGNVMTCWAEDLDWRGDSHRAGGGVLLDRAYGLIDTAVQLMGLPNTVFAAAAGVSRPGGHFPYDTEDTAATICQFTGGAMAVFSACWTIGPDRMELELFGTEASARIDNETVVLRDRPGRTVLGEQARSPNPLLGQVEEFLSMLGSNRKNIRSALRQHLSTMAVIQAAYLSARTRQPESPNTFFEMHDIQPAPSVAT